MDKLLVDAIKGSKFLTTLISISVIIITVAIILLIIAFIWRFLKAKNIKIGGKLYGQNFNIETDDLNPLVDNRYYRNLFIHKMNEVLLLSEKKHIIKNENRISKMKSKVRVFSKKIKNKIITHFTQLTESKNIHNIYILISYKYIINIIFEEIKEELYDRITQNNFDRFKTKSDWEFYKKDALITYATLMESILDDMWIEDFIERKELKKHNQEIKQFLILEGDKLFEEIMNIHNDIKSRLLTIEKELEIILEKGESNGRN